MVPADEAVSWLRLFLPEKRPANLVLLGGEPTLHPDLSLIAAAAKEMGYASVTVDTNGYLFCDILERSSPDVIDYFSFSLDGATRETCDLIRGKGCYSRCTDGIARALEKGFGVSVIFTASSRNIGELPHMPPLLLELGVKRFFIQVIGIRGRPGKEHDTGLQLTRETWLSVVPGTAEKAASAGITTIYPRVFLDEGEEFACAGLVAEDYFIFPNGRVYRCPLCEDYPLHSLMIEGGRLVPMPGINESNLFCLNIPEGCVMNRLVQPGNLRYRTDGTPEYRIACCLLKEEVTPSPPER